MPCPIKQAVLPDINICIFRTGLCDILNKSAPFVPHELVFRHRDVVVWHITCVSAALYNLDTGMTATLAASSMMTVSSFGLDRRALWAGPDRRSCTSGSNGPVLLPCFGNRSLESKALDSANRDFSYSPLLSFLLANTQIPSVRQEVRRCCQKTFRRSFCWPAEVTHASCVLVVGQSELH